MNPEVQSESEVKVAEVPEAPKEVASETPPATPAASETPKEKEARVHNLYSDLLACLKRRLNVFMVGPAGSGKTRAVEMASATLGKDFFCQSVSGQTTLAHLFGYMNASGVYVATGFRHAFEKGGVFLLDEGDAGNANVITAINSALSNGYCSFPDGMIAKHPEFVFVAAGNTYGTGANRQYVGRNALDAATLDRFVFIEWPYDEVLEASLVPQSYIDWVDLVQCYRKAAELNQIKMIISPRATLQGYELLDEGFDLDKTEKMAIWKGVDPTVIEKVKKAAENPSRTGKKPGNPSSLPSPRAKRKRPRKSLTENQNPPSRPRAKTSGWKKPVKGSWRCSGSSLKGIRPNKKVARFLETRPLEDKMFLVKRNRVAQKFLGLQVLRHSQIHLKGSNVESTRN